VSRPCDCGTPPRAAAKSMAWDLQRGETRPWSRRLWRYWRSQRPPVARLENVRSTPAARKAVSCIWVSRFSPSTLGHGRAPSLFLLQKRIAIASHEATGLCTPQRLIVHCGFHQCTTARLRTGQMFGNWHTNLQIRFVRRTMASDQPSSSRNCSTVHGQICGNVARDGSRGVRDLCSATVRPAPLPLCVPAFAPSRRILGTSLWPHISLDNAL
jgi:hypothetical protein